MTITRCGQLSGELNTTQGISLYGGGANYPTLSATKAKTGNRSYRDASASGSGFGITFPATTAIRVGFWLNHIGISTGTALSLVTIAVGASLVRVVWVPTGNYWRLYLGYQQNSGAFYLPLADLDAGAFSQPDAWRHIGVAFKCDATNGFFSLYVDGSQVLNYTGDTTVYKASSSTKEVASVTGTFALGYYSSAAWASYAYVDDFYVDSIVGESDHVPPGKRFLFSLADGAGANAQWTPLSSTNISNVDDPVSSANDGDTSYVKALESGLKDTYATAAITGPADHSIRAAIAVAIVRKTDTAASQLKLHAYDGSTYANGSDQDLTTSYAPVWERMELQPDGSAWNETDFNNCEFGFESAGSFA